MGMERGDGRVRRGSGKDLADGQERRRCRELPMAKSSESSCCDARNVEGLCSSTSRSMEGDGHDFVKRCCESRES